MSHPLASPRHHDGGRQPNKGKPHPNLVTMNRGLREVWVCWREGARLPQSYHYSRAEAEAAAAQRCRPGQTILILCAHLITSARAHAPVVSFAALQAQEAPEAQA